MRRSFLISLHLVLVWAIPATAQVTGPAPYSDPQAYGQAVPPSLTKANTSSGEATIKLASAANFKNGQYITILNAGASCGLSAPSAPRVTPSVNSAGLNTVPGNAGGSSYAYLVVGCLCQRSWWRMGVQLRSGLSIPSPFFLSSVVRSQAHAPVTT
jgi:hypothetical protein